VVIGAGFAGLAAAVRLAAAGRRVVVVEQAPRIGGRASSFIDRESGLRVDNGQHAIFGCYHHTFEFLRRIGSDALVPLQRSLDVTMADGTGRRARLRCPPLPAPWHLAAGILKWNAVGLRDRLSSVRLVGLLRRVRRNGPAVIADEVAADLTVSMWLRAQGQSAALCAWLWHPLAIAALNQRPDEAAARPFVRVLADLFAPDPRAAAIGLPSVPLEDLIGPGSVRAIESAGGRVVLRTPARVLVDRRYAGDATNGAGESIAGVRAGDVTIETRCVISTVPWHALDRIWDADPPAALAETIANASATASSPIVTVNLWFDRPTADALESPFVGFADGSMHWAFDMSQIAGVRGAGHVAVVTSGATELTDLSNEKLTSMAFEQLRQSIPELRAYQVSRSVVVREHRATCSLAPGQPARPGVGTRVRGFFLAGDWTDTGLPATIEGAVLSGHLAADRALRSDPGLTPV
jgi:zeta-carotene desaturase